MGAHALLSASSSHRWLNCPPSARLCENYKDQGSDYAQQGTDAHRLCEHKLKLALGMDTEDPTSQLAFYDTEMEDCACGYADYVLSKVIAAKKNCRNPLVMIEKRLDFSRYVPEGFGTGDCIIIADGILYIIDYKHGQGVEVSATENPQMMLYALGALELFDDIYDIDHICMCIYQPRKNNLSEYAIQKNTLLQWAENTLIPVARLAYEGGGAFQAGEHCRFCQAKATCRARAEYNMELTKLDFEPPATLDNAEIAEILTKVDELTAWVGDVKDYALQQALNGATYPGFKVVEGRSNRKYSNEEAAAKAVTDLGLNPYEQKLLSITAMTKMLGKKQFENVLGALVYKPQGKPVLVPESDKRPPMALNTARDDFEDADN